MINKSAMIVVAAVAFIFGCSIVDQNIKARKNIEKCKFDLAAVNMKKIEFRGIEPKSISLDVVLKITNTTTDDVVLDRVDADIYVDSAKTTTLNHKRFVRITPGASASEAIDLQLPAALLFKVGGNRPESITIKASVYVNVLIGSFTLETSNAVSVKKTFPIPWDRIKAEIAKKKGGLKTRLIKKIR